MRTRPNTLQTWAEVLLVTGRVWLVSRMIGELQQVPTAPEGSDFVSHRLARYAHRHGLQALDALIVDRDLESLSRIVAVQHSWFWRESEHFVFLIHHIGQRLRQGAPLRIWSAGAAMGQEAYSIAIAVLEATGARSHDVRILASDLDAVALDVGRRGHYDARAVEPLPESLRCWLRPNHDAHGARTWRVRSELAAMVEFRLANLLHLRPRPDPDTPPGLDGPFDAIFCRNVLMYFEPSSRYAVLELLASRLAPGGLLCIGMSETAGNAAHMFESCGRGMYLRRPARTLAFAESPTCAR